MQAEDAGELSGIQASVLEGHTVTNREPTPHQALKAQSEVFTEAVVDI